MKDKLKKILPYVINSFSVIAIFCLILFMSKSSPFGTKLTLGKSDALFQYKPMLYNFIMHIKTGTLFEYSFNSGLGNPFYFNFAYYLTSPLNFIGLLFNKPDTVFLSVILLKVAFASITSTFYAKKKGLSNLASFIVSISYVFCSWFIIYYYNIMWLDTFLIFPLVQYGLEKLINQKRPTIFILSLVYCFATNFLLSFSVIMYTFIYFIIKNFFYDKKNVKEKLKVLGIFILSIIFCLLILACYLHMLVVVKKAMGLGFSSADDASYGLKTLDFFKSLFYGNNILDINVGGYTFANIACNTFILLNVLFYFCNSKIKLRDKAFVLIAITLCIDCLFSVKLDYIMNFFHNVFGLTYRYVFIFCFLAIMLFIENIKNYNKDDLKKLIPIIAILFLGVILLKSKMELKVWIFNLISLIVFLLLIIIKMDNKWLKSILTIVIVIQTILVGYWGVPSIQLLKDYNLPNQEFITEPLKYRVNTIEDKENINTDYLGKNLYINADATYLFSSMTYQNVLTTLNNLGKNAFYNNIELGTGNSLLSLLFNVKGDYYLEKIYAVDAKIKDFKLEDNKKKENIENLVDTLTNVNDLFKEVKLTATKEDDDAYYFDTNNEYYLILLNGEVIAIDYNDLQIKKTSLKENTIEGYMLDKNKIKDIYDVLSKNQIKYTTYRDDLIEGSINVEENQIIFTSIPYDENWHIEVDNKEVKPIVLLDSLIGLEVPEGSHNIKMQYHCNFTKSIIISITSLVILIGITLFINKKKSLKK